MFGIGGGEFIFIMLIILMFFGSDKIPDIARTLGKGMAQLKNATNDIKGEISKGMENSGIDPNALTGGIAEEINKAKEGFSKMVNDSGADAAVKSELDQIRENFAKMTQQEVAEAKSEAVVQPEIAEIKSETAAAPAPEKIQIITPDADGAVKRQG